MRAKKIQVYKSKEAFRIVSLSPPNMDHMGFKKMHDEKMENLCYIISVYSETCASEPSREVGAGGGREGREGMDCCWCWLKRTGERWEEGGGRNRMRGREGRMMKNVTIVDNQSILMVTMGK